MEIIIPAFSPVEMMILRADESRLTFRVLR